jgi:predicted nucleotidyltransferase
MENVRLIILFGSRARGTHSPQSDYDVGVLGNHALTLEERQEIVTNLAKELSANEDKIDLVDLWEATPLLERAVSEEGKLLHGTRDDFIRFRVLAWKRYLDTAKFRRAREAALKRN